MKWRIILVAVRKFQMTLGNYFFPQGDLQTVVNYASPSCKVCPLSAISRRSFEILLLDI